MFLIGASGHAKVVIDCLSSQGIEVKGFFDRDPHVRSLKAVKVIGAHPSSDTNDTYLVSIGDNQTRKKVVDSLPFARFAKAIHASVIMSSDVQIQEGSVLMHGVIIQSSVQIGKHVIVNTNSSIDHDCMIEDFVHIAPKVALCGNVHVGEGTLIGVGASVIPNIKIGKWAIIGAGTAVYKDVPDYAVVVGNPGKIIRYTNE